MGVENRIGPNGLMIVRKRVFEQNSKLALERIKKNADALSGKRVVLFSHLGFGDQIAIAPAVEAWSSRVDELVLLEAPSNLAKVSRLYSYLPNLTFAEVPSQTLREAEEISKNLNGRLVEGGRRVLQAAKACFPKFGLNRLLCVGLLCDPNEMETHRLKRRILDDYQESVPEEPFIFLDDRPGTSRRIPEKAINAIKNKGYKIVTNREGARLESQGALLEHAKELHLVVSAPACLALAANLGKKHRNLYSNRANFLRQDYKDWRHHLVADGQRIRPMDAIDSDSHLAALSRHWRPQTRHLWSEWKKHLMT